MNRCSFGAARCDAFEKHRIGIEHAAVAGKRFLMVQAELLEFLMIMQIDQQHLDRIFGQMMLKVFDDLIRNADALCIIEGCFIFCFC